MADFLGVGLALLIFNSFMVVSFGLISVKLRLIENVDMRLPFLGQHIAFARARSLNSAKVAAALAEEASNIAQPVAAAPPNRAKSDLLADLSHELRTPINAIIGFSESMKEETFGPVGDDKKREYLDNISHAGQHLLGLINDILDLSTVEAGTLELNEENINLTNVVNASIRLVKPRAEKGRVTVTSSIDPRIPLLCVDEQRVKQVLLNLLSNAVKFTPEGGKVSVSAQLNDDGSVAICVEDNSVGMDEEELIIAMSTFGHVDSGLNRKHEGTGLGLPLIKGLMELHGGSLRVESEKGHGTIVTAIFPKERVELDV